MSTRTEQPEDNQPDEAAAEDTAPETELPAEDSEEDLLAAANARADENWEKYVRAAAELDNVRKRAQRDVENAHKFALERFVADLLAVCDSMDMALDASGEVTVESLGRFFLIERRQTTSSKSFRIGKRMVLDDE